MNDNPNELIESLIDAWCERRELAALSALLPSWLANTGMTDGWAELRIALKHTYGMCRDLPEPERDQLKRAIAAIDRMLER